MKKRIDRLRQAALEKIGVAEFTNVPKIKDDYKKVKGDEVLFKELLKHLEKQLAYLNGFVDSGEGIKVNIAAWEKVSMERGENFKLVEGLKRFGDWQNSLNQQFSKLHHIMSDRVVEVIKTFVKEDIAEARSQKKKWVKSRQLYDASEAKMAAAEKGNKIKPEEIKEDHNEVMRSYLKAEVDTSAVLANTLKGCEKLLVELVGQYWDVYSSLFQQGLQLADTVKTSLDSLQLSPSGARSRGSMSPSSPSPSDKHLSPISILSPPRLPRIPNTKIFGIYLQDLWDKETHSLPLNLVQVIDHLEEHGPSEEEIFKAPGNAKHVALIKKGLDEGAALNSCGVLGDSLSVATVLCDFLWQLPDPVIPVDVLPKFLSIADIADPIERKDAAIKLFHRMPEYHRVLLEKVIHMGATICHNTFSDLPDYKAAKFSGDLAIELAVALGPACMRSYEVPPNSAVEPAAINLFKFFILNADSLDVETEKEQAKGRGKATESPAAVRHSQERPPESSASKLPDPSSNPQKVKITQLINSIIGELDAMKLRVSTASSLEECIPFITCIKNALQNTQQILSVVSTPIAKANKAALYAPSANDDKLTKAQNAVLIFVCDLQAILTALRHHFDNDDAQLAAERVLSNLLKTQQLLHM